MKIQSTIYFGTKKCLNNVWPQNFITNLYHILWKGVILLNNLHVFLRHWSTYSWDAFLFIFFSDPNLSQDLEELKITPHENNYEFKQESNYWTFNVFIGNSFFSWHLKNLYILKIKNIKVGSGWLMSNSGWGDGLFLWATKT